MTFIPYQVDHQVQNVAKTLGMSKKKVNFKFGFASQAAIDEGLAGAACRGSEHEVVFVWSLKSGKRQLMLNGRDVHFSESGQNGWTTDRSWQHSFPLRDPATNQEYRIHFISQPDRREIPGFHPFDLRINGISYFKFNEIWKLGSRDMATRGQSRGGGGGGGRSGYRQEAHPDHGLSSEEQRQIAQAKLESLRDLAQKEQQQVNSVVADNPASPPGAPDANSLITFESSPPSQVIVPAQQTNAFAAPSAPAYGAAAFAVPPAPAPAPAYGGAALDPYAAGATTAVTPYTGATAPYGGGVAAPPPPAAYPPQQPPAYGAPPPAYGAPPPAYTPQTPGAPPAAAPTANPFASPSGQTEYSYGSAPAFARPPAAAPGYPPATQQPQPGYPPQQPQQQQQYQF